MLSLPYKIPKTAIPLIVFFILLVGLIANVLVTQQNQDIRQRAQTTGGGTSQEQACVDSGGAWQQFSNGCADTCGTGPGSLCTQAIVDSCNCGANACWNGATCVSDSAGGGGEVPAPSVAPIPIGDSGTCIVTGCNGEICSDTAIGSDCIYQPEYACYQSAACEVQSNGACGWTQTMELQQCIASAQNPTPTAPSGGSRPECRAADINKDGTVDIDDANAVLADLFSTSPGDPRVDINADGIVDILDYSLVATSYSQSTGACI